MNNVTIDELLRSHLTTKVMFDNYYRENVIANLDTNPDKAWESYSKLPSNLLKHYAYLFDSIVYELPDSDWYLETLGELDILNKYLDVNKATVIYHDEMVKFIDELEANLSLHGHKDFVLVPKINAYKLSSDLTQPDIIKQVNLTKDIISFWKRTFMISHYGSTII